MAETLRADVVSNTSDASRGFRELAAGMQLSSREAKQLGQELRTQTAALKTADEATKTLARGDKTLRDAELLLAGATGEATNQIQQQGRAAEETAAKTRLAGTAAKGAGSNFGLLASPMGAAVGAGVALAPVIATLAVGLGGLGLAAYGIAKPIENAASKTGGLAANMKLLDPEQQAVARGILGLGQQYDQFQNALKPEVLSVFSGGLRLAGGLLHDIQPVAAATGKALSGVLGSIDAEFRSGTWQQFFGFMAQTAGPDVQLLGKVFTDLLHDLPPLLTALQPLAVELLHGADNTALLLGKLAQLAGAAENASGSLKTGADGTQQWAQSTSLAGQATHNAWNELIGHLVPGLDKTLPYIQKYGEELLHAGDAGNKAAKGANDTAQAAGAAGQSAKAAHAPTTQQIADAVSLGKGSADAAVHLRATADATTAAGAAAKGAKPPTDAQNAALYVTDKNAADAASSVTSLNSAWSAFLGLSTSLVTAQLGVEGGLKALTTDAKAAGASFTGTNDASQKLQTDFESNLVPGLQNVLNGMRKAGASSHDLATVLATDLKPAADRGALANKALEQQIFDLAVQAGYTGPNKLKPLRDWIDHNAGSAQNAANKVNQFGAALANLPKSESLRVVMQGRGTYAIINSTTGQPYPIRAAAGGAFISAGTTPTADDQIARVSKGELIVPARMVSSGAVDHLRGSIPGFAAGGYTGQWNLTPGFVQGMHGDFRNAITSGTSQALSAGLAAALRAGIAQAAASFSAGPSGTGTAGLAQAFARSLFPAHGWGAGQWPYLLALWNRESGWNAAARNPTSGAAGIPQDITGNFHGGYRGQVIWGEDYIAGRYGTPAGAWAHETAFNWYDRGGLLKPGLTLALNTSGRAEQVIPAAGPGGSGAAVIHVHLENRGVIGSKAELQAWLHQGIDELARGGKLRYALRQSPSAA